MTTSRLDSLAAGGTDNSLVRIRLADATTLAVNIWPRSDHADVVRLIAPLTAPDTDGWEYEDQVESWLTGGDYSDYVDVPLEAVRDLIAEHGGEHQDQDYADSGQTTH